MITFISLSGHFAAAYLHLLLSCRFFSQRRDNDFVHLFWFLMMVSFVLHAIYGVNYVALMLDRHDLSHYLIVSGYCLLSFYPALLGALFLGDLAQPPHSGNWLTRILGQINANTKRLIATCVTLSVCILFLGVFETLGAEKTAYSFGNEYALFYLLIIAGLWAVMFAAGFRPAQRRGQTGNPLFGYANAIIVLACLNFSSYIFELGQAWNLIPIISTTALSLTFCWYRLRTQFMDVVLSQFLRIIALIAFTVLLASLLGMLAERKATYEVQLVLMSICTLAFAVAYFWINAGIKALWYPPMSTFSKVHTELPLLLRDVLNKDYAIKKTEAYLSRLFNTKVRINANTDRPAIQTLYVEGDPKLVIELDYMRTWMPWFSEALNWVRTAGLYLQSHLKMLDALQKEHQEQLNIQKFKSHAAKAELIAMRAQIRPHFMFNCLNSIHSFVTHDSKQAESMIEKLAELLRGVLRMSDANTVKVKRELELVDNYIGIEKIRYGDHLQYQIRVQPGCEEMSVPSFSIQPLVENAIKYAVDTQLEPATININVWKTASFLKLEVEDDGQGLTDAQANGLGMAMQNIENRLKHLYGKKGELTLTNGRHRGAVATICIPLAP